MKYLYFDNSIQLMESLAHGGRTELENLVNSNIKVIISEPRIPKYQPLEKFLRNKERKTL